MNDPLAALEQSLAALRAAWAGDGWEIRIDGPGTTARVWFIPPVWLDAARTPRLGGRARFDVALAS